MTETHKGRLLVAQPSMEDPNFARSVVLILEHNEEGTLGVILNRPTSAVVSELMDDWDAVCSSPQSVFWGGPVQPEVGICLARVIATDEQPIDQVVGSFAIVDLSRAPSLQGILTDARMFSGYAGWDTAQLEWELALDSWFVVDATEADIATDAPHELWRTVLRRQQASLAFYADFPEDLGSN